MKASEASEASEAGAEEAPSVRLLSLTLSLFLSLRGEKGGVLSIFSFSLPLLLPLCFFSSLFFAPQNAHSEGPHMSRRCGLSLDGLKGPALRRPVRFTVPTRAPSAGHASASTRQPGSAGMKARIRVRKPRVNVSYVPVLRGSLHRSHHRMAARRELEK